MKEKTFSEMMTRLEQIVSLLEKGDASLEDSLSLFDEGNALIKGCNEKLNDAKLKIAGMDKPEPEQNDE